MTFKLPAIWDPAYNYAVPQYMTDEGLTSRARVTKWAPRGTYDNPDAFDPSWDKSYATPGYVLKEGYGQGAKVTEWYPRGYYDGSTVARIKAMQGALGDVTTPEPFAAYGRRASATILAKLRSVPPGLRKGTLQKIMGAIDPTLYGKAAGYATAHERRGVPSAQALELGISRAMSEGIGNELVALGKKKVRPKAKGQVGLAAYGARAVLGADLMSSPAIAQIVAVASTAPGTCSADGQFIWAIAADGTGFWRKLSVGEACTATSTIQPEVSTGGGGGISGTILTNKTQMIDVGPFKVPLSAYTIMWGNRPLPQEWQDFVVAQLATNPDKAAGPGTMYGRLRDFIPNLPVGVNHKFVGFVADKIGESSTFADQPIVVVKRPDNGEEWGIYMQVSKVDTSKDWDSSTNPWILKLEWRPKRETLWAWIKRIVGKIVDVVADVLDAVGDVACKLIGTSGAGIAAAGVAASQGAPPQTGAAGVSVAQQACAGQQPPQAPAGESMMPLVIAGGVLGAIYLLTRRKRTA